MSADKVLQIGFVGAGNMGQMAHLRHYVHLPACKVVALYEPRPDHARNVAARYGIERVYPSAREMLENEKLDGLVVPQPFDRHGQIVTPLYEYGVPILTEKPLAASVEVAEQMVAALDRSTSFHMVGYHKRSDPATVWAKAEIERLKSTQELGALRYIRITMPPGDWAANGFNELLTSDESLPPELQTPADAPAADLSTAEFRQYTSFVNYYIHQVNLLRYLFGENYCPVYADRAGVLLVAESESGVTGAIEMAPYNTRLGWEESALVGFEQGYVKLSLPAPLTWNRAGEVEVLYGGESPRKVTPVLPPEGAFRCQAQNFLRAIKGEIAPPCEAHEALKDLYVAREYLDLFLRIQA
jgi:predicted dehydrogenase